MINPVFYSRNFPRTHVPFTCQPTASCCASRPGGRQTFFLSRHSAPLRLALLRKFPLVCLLRLLLLLALAPCFLGDDGGEFACMAEHVALLRLGLHLPCRLLEPEPFLRRRRRIVRRVRHRTYMKPVGVCAMRALPVTIGVSKWGREGWTAATRGHAFRAPGESAWSVRDSRLLPCDLPNFLPEPPTLL